MEVVVELYFVFVVFSMLGCHGYCEVTSCVDLIILLVILITVDAELVYTL